MKNIILFLLLFCSIGLSAQVRPDQQAEKKPEGTDAIYTQETGQLRKVLFDSAFYYFIPRIKTDTLTYSIISANNPDSLRGFFVVDNTATWYYVDSAAASVSIGSGGGGTTQLLSFSDPNLSISGGNTVDLSALKDGTGTDDQTAAEVAVTPTGNLSSADVQSALEEHQTDIDGLSSGAADGVATAGTYDAINEEIDITVASPGSNFSIDVSAFLDNTDSISFKTTYTTDPQRGTLIWNNDDETLDLGINGVVLQIGQEMLAHIKNQTGSTINNGTVVRYSGSVGASGRMEGDLMIADGTYPAYHTIGVTTEDIPNGEDGFVTVFGVVGGINTTAYSAGDILYVSTTVEGALTDTVPEAPDLKIPIAVVLNSGNNGAIFVRPTILPALNDIADVEITSPVNNSILKYDSTAGTWIDVAYPTILSEAEVSAIVSDTADVLRTYTDQAEQDAKDYADTNDDSGTDDQTLQEVLAQGNTTSSDIVFSVDNNLRNTSGQIIGTVGSNGDIFRGWSSLGSLNRLDIGYLSSFNTIFRSAGNVGIGTLSPSEKLHLIGNMFINQEGSGLIVDSGSNKRVGFMKYSGLETSLVHGNTVPLRFGRVDQANVAGGNYTEEMRIATNGNVGIGTTSPEYKLDVGGTVGFPSLSDGSAHTEIVTRDGVTGELGYATNNISNWNTAFGWGDHSTAGYLTSEVDGSTTNELQTISVSGDDIALSDSGGSVSVINTVESNTAASTTITIDLESARNRVVQIDMTSASTASTVTLSASNPITGGVYTFHLQNTDSGGHDVDFPANFLKADGTAWDESTTVNYAADEWLTCYFDGTNYYCK